MSIQESIELLRSLSVRLRNVKPYRPVDANQLLWLVDFLEALQPSTVMDGDEAFAVYHGAQGYEVIEGPVTLSLTYEIEGDVYYADSVFATKEEAQIQADKLNSSEQWRIVGG